jgi:hypothetical protein
MRFPLSWVVSWVAELNRRGEAQKASAPDSEAMGHYANSFEKVEKNLGQRNSFRVQNSFIEPERVAGASD